ncbi:cuticle protein 16.5 [Sabethes cyaneus]|uniref:cuticle protein 16.5 n=1 Tax=Sabethes cyaneus TaxID=53552 RepID=UPI00237D63AE|nr:cuticle protein 16.5 [Sabethes cyaneus]
MFKIICLLVIVALASVSAEPKPGVLAYSAPLVAAPAAAVYERTYHGNIAPLAAAYAAAPYVASPYVAAPLAYSAPYVAAAPAPVFLK